MLLSYLVTAVLELGTSPWHDSENTSFGSMFGNLYSQTSLYLEKHLSPFGVRFCSKTWLQPFYLDIATLSCGKNTCSSAIKNLLVFFVHWSVNLVVPSSVEKQITEVEMCAAGWLQEYGLSHYHLCNCYTYIMKLCQLQPLCKWMHTLFQTLCCSVD